jgi:RNA polymerase sigma factor (sigma-70 family)
MANVLISDDDLDVLLDAANPVELASLNTVAITRALVELREASLAPADSPTPTPTRQRRRAVPRMLLATGSVAIATAVVVLLVGLGGSGGGASSDWLVTVAPAQAAELGRVAAAAAQQNGPGPGQWLYQRYQLSEGGYSGWKNAWVTYRDTRLAQQWTNANNTQRLRSVYTNFSFDSPRSLATYRRYRSELPGLSVDGPLAKGGVTDYADPGSGSSPGTPQNMPDTRVGLLDRIQRLSATAVAHSPAKDRAQMKKQRGLSLFGELSFLLQQSTSARQRAAALQALAYVPGVRMLGDRRDIRGRMGLAIRYVWQGGPGDGGGSGTVLTIIVDRQTGYILQDTMTSLRPFGDMTPAQSLVRTVYLQTAIVNSMSSLPGGGSLPYHGPPPTIAKTSPVTADQFRSLHDHTARELLAYLLRRTANPDDAADCLAETFLIAWAKRDQIPAEEGQARPWLFGVARNVLRRTRETTQNGSTAAAALARELSRPPASAAIETPMTLALAQLSPLDREIIEMLAWDGLTPREVATILELTPNVVRIRSHRARLKLREHLTGSTIGLAGRVSG